jgi:peptide chain release factor 2
MAASGFWDDQETARKVIDEANGLKRWTEPVAGLTRAIGDLEELLELAEDDDEAMLDELRRDAARLDKRLDELETLHMLSGKDDERNAILTIHPGAGGTESQDWAQMLMRMYTRYCEIQGFKYTVMDLLPGDEAGIKSVSIEVKGEYAYGYLKAEKGVHRLVRISPYDANSRRHTSFASVFVFPEVEDSI